jgi:DNA-binding GntR family transcriptional regulator
MKIFKYIDIDENSRKPKYIQIVDSVRHNITQGKFVLDQKMPSINMLSEEFYLSRDTVEKAYGILKERKIITSVRGKGFYIARTNLISKTNILFLVNKLSSYKLQIYSAFNRSIGANTHTNLQVYHCDESLFLNLLEKNITEN